MATVEEIRRNASVLGDWVEQRNVERLVDVLLEPRLGGWRLWVQERVTPAQPR